VPGFDPTVPIRVPVWTDMEDIFHFAQSFLLFFRLQAKVRFYYDDRTRSGMFLRGVQSTEYADTVTTLLSHVNTFRQEFDDGYLPPHLRVHGLATSIHQATLARLRDVTTPRVRLVTEAGQAGDFSLPRGQPSRVQGVPQVHRFSHDGGRGRGGPTSIGHVPYDTGRMSHGVTPDRGRPSRPPRGPGRLARPDRNRRPFLPDVQCAACKRVGHVAKHCDMLATAICLERYMKADLSPALRDSIEQEWLERWKERLGNPTVTPRQVLRAYVEDLDITVANLDDEMEWDAWVDGDFDAPADE